MNSVFEEIQSLVGATDNTEAQAALKDLLNGIQTNEPIGLLKSNARDCVARIVTLCGEDSNLAIQVGIQYARIEKI